MLFNIRVGNINAGRETLLQFLRTQKQADPEFSVIDVGGSAGGWSHSVADWIVDINPVDTTRCFKANLNRYDDWQVVRDYVAEHGKFSFAICSHTLEDIANPMLVLEMLPQIADQGYIAVPSKYREFARIEGAHLGYIHHRWIFNIRPEEPNLFVGFPKLGFLEYATELHRLGDTSSAIEELAFRWKDRIPYRIVNDDYLGPTSGAVKEYYRALL
jgi:hypothetical protein